MGPLFRAYLPRIAAHGLVLFYFGLAIAAYGATLRPGPLSLRVGQCGQDACVSWVMPAGRAWQAGARPGMRVVSVDGQVVPQLEGLYSPAAPVAEAELLTTAGQLLLVELVQEAVTEAPIKFPLWFLGGVFALLGAAVLLRRPDLDSSRWFAAFAGSAAVALTVGPAAGGPNPIGLWLFKFLR